MTLLELEYIIEGIWVISADGKFVVQSASLSSSGENSLSIEQWCQGSSHLVTMCGKYLCVGSLTDYAGVTLSCSTHSQQLTQILTQIFLFTLNMTSLFVRCGLCACKGRYQGP
jgi:hypothetical protein